MSIRCAARESILQHVFGLTLRHITLISSRPAHSRSRDPRGPRCTFVPKPIHRAPRNKRNRKVNDGLYLGATDSSKSSLSISVTPPKPVHNSPESLKNLSRARPPPTYHLQDTVGPSLSISKYQHAKDLREQICSFYPPANYAKAKRADIQHLFDTWNELMIIINQIQFSQTPLSPKFLESHHFDSIIVALSYTSTTRRRYRLSDKTPLPSIPFVLDFMTSKLDLEPTKFQLNLLMKDHTLSPLVAVPASFREILPREITPDFVENRLLPLWDHRRELLDSLRRILGDERPVNVGVGEVINVTLVEAGLIGAREDLPQDTADRIREQVAFWCETRDEWVERARMEVNPLLWSRNISSEDEPSTTEQTTMALNRQNSLMSLLVADLHLNSHLRNRPGQAAQSHLPFDPNNPLELIRMMMELSRSRGSPAIGDHETLYRAILYTRHIVRRRGQFNKFLSLISLIAPPSPSDDEHVGITVPLPGTIHASLLTAARDPDELCRLMVSLYHLPPPVGRPASVQHKRRLLRYLAYQADHQYHDNVLGGLAQGQSQSNVINIVWSTGWQGLLEHLLVKWGDGLPMEQWQKMERAREDGDEELLRQIQEENERAYAITPYFPRQLPPRARQAANLNERWWAERYGKGAVLETDAF